MRVSRFDVSEIGKPQRTPQGFLRVPAALTRAGVFEYRRHDGKIVRELRPPEEVFRADSLASLGYAPVTDLHPTTMVSPENVKQLSVGHVSANVRQDGQLVSGFVTVEDAAIIAKVEKRERREISCGYQCRIDATPGTYNGQAYDCVQRDIVYNHAALGPSGWGRAGRDVALRVDSADDDKDDKGDTFRLDSDDAVIASTFGAPGEPRDDGGDMDQVTIRVDGIDTQVPKQSAQLIEKAIKSREDSVTTLTKERDTLQGKLDAQVSELAELKKKLDESGDPKRLDAAVNARATLLEQARRVLDKDHKFDGQSTRQIQEAVLKKLDDKLDLTGKSDEYVGARFDAKLEHLPAGHDHKRTDALDHARRVTTPGGNGGNGGGSNESRNDAAPYVPEWQRPLATSKDAR